MRMRLKVLIALSAVVMLALGCTSARRIVRDRLPPPHEVEGGILFSYSAPAARMVTLAGQFNNWAGTQGGGRYDPTIDPMSDEDGDGIWTIVKPLPPGRYQYKFVIDNGAVWELDPSNALTGEEGGFTNSLLIVPDDIAYTPSVVTGMELPGTLDRGAKKPAKQEVTLELDRPDAEKVHVAGQFNEWKADDIELKKGADGIWRTTLTLEPGTYTYKFIVNGQDWIEDPANPDKVPDPYGGHNSLLTVGAGTSAVEPKKKEKPPAAEKPAQEARVYPAGEVVIELDRPDADFVHVAGEFNDWKPDDIALTKGDDGIWRTTLDLEAGRYEYKFIVNGQDWIEDPANPDKVPDPYGGNNSVLTVE
ncbi:MAG: glycogen-binding domain-containing protein [bacterium]|jgi:1,4-alpha-glucan branching enzyme